MLTHVERATGGQERQAFLASGAPIPRDVLFRLREEGYFFVGRQAVSPQFNAIPRRGKHEHTGRIYQSMVYSDSLPPYLVTRSPPGSA